MRTKQVVINNKTINVNEKRIVELKSLITGLSTEADTVLKANAPSDLLNVVNDIFGAKLIQVFPELTQDDIDNSYPSELEELAGAFVDVNFTGIKKIAAPFLAGIQKGLLKR